MGALDETRKKRSPLIRPVGGRVGGRQTASDGQGWGCGASVRSSQVAFDVKRLEACTGQRAGQRCVTALESAMTIPSNQLADAASIFKWSFNSRHRRICQSDHGWCLRISRLFP